MNRAGIVYYADDPNRVIFRTVFLTGNDPESVLDDPCWVKEGCDPDRVARLIKLKSLADVPTGFTRTMPLQIEAKLGDILDIDTGSYTVHGIKAGLRYDPLNDLPLPIPDGIPPSDVVESK